MSGSHDERAREIGYRDWWLNTFKGMNWQLAAYTERETAQFLTNDGHIVKVDKYVAAALREAERRGMKRAAGIADTCPVGWDGCAAAGKIADAIRAASKEDE